MRPELELAIHDLLVVGKDSHLVSEQIVDKLIKDSHQFKQKSALIQFVIRSGNFSGAYKVFQKWFETKQKVPWQDFLNLVYKSKALPVEAEFLSYFFQALEETDSKGQLTVLKHWEEYDSRFSMFAEQFRNNLYAEAKSIEEQNLEKLQYFKNNRMLGAEEKLLRELLLAYPERQDLKTELEKLKTRWAHNFIADKSHDLENKKFAIKLTETEDTSGFANHLFKVMNLSVGRYPNAAYDFAIGLSMMGFYEQALKMLERTMPGIAVDWFRAELLLKSRRYLECLDELIHLERTYRDDPESSFASTYLRAQVLKGLGQSTKAIELMKSITNIRPAYRSAHGLIIEWERDA